MKCNLIKFQCCWQTNHRAHTICMWKEEMGYTEGERKTKPKKTRTTKNHLRRSCHSNFWLYNWKSIKMHSEWNESQAGGAEESPSQSAQEEAECWPNASGLSNERAWTNWAYLVGHFVQLDGTVGPSNGNHWIQFKQFPASERCLAARLRRLPVVQIKCAKHTKNGNEMNAAQIQLGAQQIIKKTYTHTHTNIKENEKKKKINKCPWSQG